jgi:hypothetical protein
MKIRAAGYKIVTVKRGLGYLGPFSLPSSSKEDVKIFLSLLC